MPKARKSNAKPKQRKRGDRSREYELRNIRRRFERQAARYERQAEGADPVDRKQLMAAAATLRQEAQSYYARNITAERFNTEAGGSAIRQAISKGRPRSLEQLAGAVASSQQERERLTRTVLSGPVGDVFYASTVEIWKGSGYRDRNVAILERFQEQFPDEQIRDVLDIVAKMQEATGIPLLEPGVSDDEAAEFFYRSNQLEALYYVTANVTHAR